MTLSRKIIFMALGGFMLNGVEAQEVYRWVDENGVVNFSDKAPVVATANAVVNTLTLQDSTPTDYDPEEDIYNVAAQAERMQALRDEMAKDREARREQQNSAPRQAVTPYQKGVNYGYPYGYPVYPRPPLRPPARPEPPAPEPYDTSTLVPPGQRQVPDRR
jgi:hypothetical protein